MRSYGSPPPALVCIIVEQDATDSAAQATDAGEIESWTLAKVGLSAAELGYRKHFRPTPGKGPVPAPLAFADVEALAARLKADGVVGEDD